MLQTYKIIFTGLDFAGKTSILNVLEGSYSGLDGIKPTLGTEKTEWTILGIPVINWDLGGQKRYRDEYLKNHRNILSGTDLVIFVLDIQDKPRVSEAANFFNDLINTFNELKIKCPVLLCLHKADPDVFDSATILRATNLFSEIAKKYDIKIKFFNTSIFNRKSLIEMFSHGVSELIELAIINKILKEFSQEPTYPGILGTILFDDNFFMVGHSFSESSTQDICFETVNAFISLSKDIKDFYDESKHIDIIIPANNNIQYNFSLLKLLNATRSYYLLIMGTPTLEMKQAFSIFVQKYLPKILTSIPT